MSSTLVAEPPKARSKAQEQRPASTTGTTPAESMGSPAGMPAFLQFAVAEPLVQTKCACGGQASAGGNPSDQPKCAHCEAEEEEGRRRTSGPLVQTKCAHCEEEEEARR